jgi:LacI family repressor for deo operon, udp, cdd, tsx, nupC, and nupG
MHGRGRISPATRQRVLQRIEEAGYTPNVHAQRLRAGRTHIIALNFGTMSGILANMFFVELTRGIQTTLEAHGYDLLLNAAHTVPQRWVRSRAADGMILVRGDMGQDGSAQDIVQAGMPCVVLGHHLMEETPGVGSVVVGLSHGVQQVAQMLVEHGHRRIGFLGNEIPQDMVLAMFRAELQKLGLDLPEQYVNVGHITPDDGERGMRTLLAQPNPPTAVFARSDEVAVGALRAARQQGLRVPADLSIIGHDDVPFAALAEPPLTTVQVNCAELGNIAAEMLLALIHNPQSCLKAHVVQTELVVRQSVARKPSA